MSPTVVSLDSSVLEKCYFDHYNMLVGLARTLVDDIESAEEVVQHVFTSAAKNRVHFKEGDALNYIRIAVVNQSRSQLRKRKTQRKHLAVVNQETLDNTAHRSDATELSASSIALKNALAGLPRRQRECISLAYLENLSHPEIASALDISIGSVKQHITRGVISLHRALKDKS
ncbi:MAG TPA: sigma-70 family RNA polymerase sigma factor [Acidimicrobiia bacterium]|jgi:RNA polymerase sigma factor (sigma-70 family)|nr:sigma-70 family RNA polymerase sigma factor [Acidimicrobiia bacterium]